MQEQYLTGADKLNVVMVGNTDQRYGYYGNTVKSCLVSTSVKQATCIKQTCIYFTK